MPWYRILFNLLYITFFWPTFWIWICRLNAMTFKTFGRSIEIKNEKLAGILIAYKNTWGIATSADKRNKMSMSGIISYLMYLPQIYFVLYDWWICITTGVAQHCEAEKTYIAVVGIPYLFMLGMKVEEANRYNKGKIW